MSAADALVRIIPRLDIKGENLVKGIQLEGIRVLGRPSEFARIYYEEGADELLYMDAVASLYGRNSILPLVESTAREVFIPLMVGGGLRSVDDVRAALRAGADKVCLNTAVVERPELVRTLAQKFGSSTIVVSIEAKLTAGGYEVYTHAGRESSGVDVSTWAVQAVELGAGELMVTSIDREGTGRGYDEELTRRIARLVPVPVIACGGAGSAEDVARVIKEGEADAVSLASILHYHTVERLRAEFGASTHALAVRRPAAIQPHSLPQLRASLRQQGVSCRETGPLEATCTN